MRIRHVALGALAALVFSACSCSGIEQQESSYRYRLEKLKAMAAEATPELKADIEKDCAAYEKEYAALPHEANARGEGLGKLNQKMTASLDAYGKRVEADAQAARGALLALLAGDWQGPGIDLAIDKGGSVHYVAREGVSKKQLDLPIQKITSKSFEVGALGINTTFKIDVPSTATS